LYRPSKNCSRTRRNTTSLIQPSLINGGISTYVVGSMRLHSCSIVLLHIRMSGGKYLEIVHQFYRNWQSEFLAKQVLLLVVKEI
ncbi:hypothetical protein Tsubulata_043217, partial [Turnera subulata]